MFLADSYFASLHVVNYSQITMLAPPTLSNLGRWWRVNLVLDVALAAFGGKRWERWKGSLVYFTVASPMNQDS